MPWEKSFDEDVALDKAVQVFWAKGFEPASIADLLAGTGLNRGSLYNAFGGKRQLFVLALEKYDRDHRRQLLASLEAMDDPLRAIDAFFDAVVAETVGDPQHKGCFLFNTALEIGSHDAEVAAIVTNGVRETEAFLKRCIEVGQARGEVALSLEADATAKSMLASLVAIRVLGRGVFAEDALQTIATQAKKLVAA